LVVGEDFEAVDLVAVHGVRLFHLDVRTQLDVVVEVNSLVFERVSSYVRRTHL